MLRNNISAVVIGRNEGDRLKRCLLSLKNNIEHIVYVDSGSTDESVGMARSLGVEVVNLDVSVPFTAARARNAGAQYVSEHYPGAQFIQFVDGDCEVDPAWISTSVDFLKQHVEYAVTCGRRRERFPQASIYNELCDLEWDTPIGDTLACGGDALIRTDTFKAVNGYKDDLIAGEEPEMCFRLRQLGWKIRRLDAEMTLHDAAMTKLSQWWKRAKRAGFAYAASYDLHGQSPEHFRKKETRGIVVWGLFLPLLIIVLSLIDGDMLWSMLIYPLQLIRLYQRYRIKLSTRKSLLLAGSNTFAKFPQACGVMSYLVNRYKGTKARLIEYK